MKVLKKNIQYNLIALLFGLILYFSLSINLIFGAFVAIIILLLIKGKVKIFYCLFLQIIFFQNTFIALFSGFTTEENFKILHAVNFVIPAVLFVYYLVENKMSIKKVDFLNISLTIILILLVYFFFGLFNYGVQNSAAYLRLFTVPIFMLFSGLYFSGKLEQRFYDSTLKMLLLACAFVASVQILFPKQMGVILNELSYYKMKNGIESWNELFDFYGRHNLFNVSWIKIKAVRIGSLIKSVISLGYFLLILGLYYYWPKKKPLLLWFFILIVLAVNSKGVLLLLILTMLLYFLIYKTNMSKGVAVLSYLLINAVVIVIGLKNNNEHMLGFVHGSSYIFSLGNGLGFAGNLSSTMLTSWHGPALPDLGYWTRFRNGSESVFGVLFSSLGIFSLVYMGYFLVIIYLVHTKMKTGTPQGKILNILIIILFVQGIFQEEAFSPYAFGLVMFLVGLNLKFAKNESKDISV